ncbi:MAG TPA: hypothetical protein VK843_20940 [Planctomycetota bacterium]|nr:hypothetical protein [Planctomycetota bacterium]
MRVALVGIVLAIAAFSAIRMIRAELALTGGEISLPVDDAFIYLQYARAIAEGHPFAYTAGSAPSSGSTSLWYPLLLLPPHLLDLSPTWCISWALSVGFVGYCLCALLVARLAHNLGGVGSGLLALALFFFSPLLLWGFLSGMELALYGTALLGTTLAYLRERKEARFRTLPWWMLALAGSRPEGAVLCGVLGVVMVVDRWRVSKREEGRVFWTPALLIPWIAAALPFAVNLAIDGYVEPMSSQAKSIFSEPYPDTRRELFMAVPGVLRDTASLFLSLLDPGRGFTIPAPLAFVNIAAVLLFVVLAWKFRQRWASGASLLLLIGAGILLNSIAVSRFTHHFRYQHGIFLLFLVLLATGWGRLSSLAWSAAPRPLKLPLAAAALLVPLSTWIAYAVPELRRVPEIYARNCENILHQQVDTGRWIDLNLSHDAVVGLNDAGAIAYYSRRSTVDMLGLTSAGYARAARSGAGCLFEHARRAPLPRKPSYFAVYPGWFPGWKECGILNLELHRSHLELNTICAESDKIVFAAEWNGGGTPESATPIAPALPGRRLVDSLDAAWLPDEQAHDWSSSPPARSVVQAYALGESSERQIVDGGRIVLESAQFRVAAEPASELEMAVRTDARFSSRLRVTVGYQTAGIWEIAKSETGWVEPRFTIPAALVTGSRIQIKLERELSEDGGCFSPFQFWFYQ